MKTIRQALIDDVHYPLPGGCVDNALIRRALESDGEFTTAAANSAAYQGALADCLYSLISAVSFSEADKSVGNLTDRQLTAILARANSLYVAIGEEPREDAAQPTVHIGGYWWLAHFSHFYHSQNIDIQRHCKTLYRDTNP